MRTSPPRLLVLLGLMVLVGIGAANAQRPPVKKNKRPVTVSPVSSKETNDFLPVYSYEFSKPEFLVSHVLIRHDEKGVGEITFTKQHYEEELSDPVRLSAKTTAKLNALWECIGFLNSSDVYQSPERDYAHLGTIKLTMEKDGRKRTEELNWTEIPEVKELVDEYRRIGNQYVWMFDMNVARRNQPLETPRMMNGLDSYLRLNGFADLEQILPYLKELSEDERIPLIARNHASRVIKQIRKTLVKDD